MFSGWQFLVWVLAGVMLVVGLVVPVEHHGGWWEDVPGWWSWFGLGGALVLVLVARLLGGAFIQQREGWYDDDED